MVTRSRPIAVAALGALLFLAPRPAGASWQADGTLLAPAPANPSAAASDSAGNAIACVLSGTLLYAQKIDSSGVVQWGPSGVLLDTLANVSAGQSICSDRAGGAIVVWSDGHDIWGQRLTANGMRLWGANGVVICGASGDQLYPLVTSDLAGGVVAAWEDHRSPGAGLYTRRVDAAGTALWTAEGVALFTGTLDRPDVVVTDTLSGAFVVWETSGTIRARRVDRNGQLSGPVILNTYLANAGVVAAADSAGGVIAVWRRSSTGMFAGMRMSATGTRLWSIEEPPLIPNAPPPNTLYTLLGQKDGWWLAWASSEGLRLMRFDLDGMAQLADPTGVFVASVRDTVWAPALVSDPPAGAIVVFRGRLALGRVTTFAQRYLSSGGAAWPPGGVPVLFEPYAAAVTVGDGGAIVLSPSARAMRVLSSGVTPPYLPSAWTAIDSRADQGGWVQLDMTAPRADGEAVFPVTGYQVWRRSSETASRSQPAEAASMPFPPGAWEAVAYVAAGQLPVYRILAPTRNDSSGSGPADEQFLIAVHTSIADFYALEGPVTAHSVDNLAPLPPQNLAGSESGSTVRLTWTSNIESDLWSYTVHRGDQAGFVPSTANRIGYTVDPEWTDAAPVLGAYYKVAAIDRHGNVSIYSALGPDQIGGVPSLLPRETFLAAPAPNPAANAVVISFGAAREGRVGLVIYDLNGRRVKTLVGDSMPAGFYRRAWNRTTESGHRAPAGLYLVRLEAPGTEIVRRLVIRD